MATATLTSQLTDVSLDPGSPTNIGTANAQASETEIQLQGANCAATGHAGAVGPTAPTAISQFRGCYTTVTSFTRTDMHVHLWLRDLYPIRDVNVGGIAAYVFGSSEAIYYVTGLDKGYAGGWVHVVLNLDPGDRPAASLGTAPSANITRVGGVGNISVTKGEDFLQNFYVDAIRRGTAGQGITFRGGTSGDRLTFLNCADADAQAYGLFRNVAGSFIIEGPVTFGVATQLTYLTESLKTLNFANLTVNNGTGGNTIVSAVAPDYFRLTALSGTTGATVIEFTDITFNGVAAAPFDFIFGLTNSQSDSYTGLRNVFINMNDLVYASGCSSTDERFVNAVGQIWPASITMLRPIFTNCVEVLLTASGSAISGGSTQGHNTAASSSFMTTDDLGKITGHDFDNTGGTGHAVELTSIGGGSMNWNNTDAGYAATDGSTGNETIFVNVGAGTLTINVAAGATTPTIRTAGATVNVVAGALTLTVKCVTQLGAPIQNVRVRVEATNSGPIANGTAIIDGLLTNASGEVTDTRTYGAAQDIVGAARKSSPGDVPLYQQGDIIGTIDGADLTVTVVMIPDE
jgi:hypothetical protein